MQEDVSVFLFPWAAIFWATKLENGPCSENFIKLWPVQKKFIFSLLKLRQNFFLVFCCCLSYHFSNVHVLAGFRNNFQNHRWLSEQLLWLPESRKKRDYWSNFQNKWFHRSKQKLYFQFSSKRQPNIVRTISTHTKSVDLIYRFLQKIFILWLYPFKSTY